MKTFRTTTKRITALLLPLAFFVFGACEALSDEEIQSLLLPQVSGDNYQVRVISTNPLDGLKGLKAEDSIYAIFSAPMDEQQTQSAFSMASSTGSVTGAFRWEGQKMVFEPKAALADSGEYTMTVGRQSESITGVDMGQDYIVRFYALADTDKPEFVSSSPADGQTGVSQSTSIDLTFTEEIDFATIADGISVSPSFLNTASVSGNVVTINPQSNLTVGTIYTVTINTSLTDLSGNPLRSEKTLTFVVGSDFGEPSISSAVAGATTLTEGIVTTGIEKTDSIVITFSEAMDQVSTESAITFSPTVSNSMTWSGGNTVLTITPTTSFDSEENYTLTIDTTAEDSAGNGLDQSYTYPFFTDGATSVKPAVQEVRLENGSGAATCDGQGYTVTYGPALSNLDLVDISQLIDRNPAGGSETCVVRFRVLMNNTMVLTSLLSEVAFTKIFDSSGGSMAIYDIQVSGTEVFVEVNGAPFPGGTGTPTYKLVIGADAFDTNGNTLGTDYELFLTF